MAWLLRSTRDSRQNLAHTDQRGALRCSLVGLDIELFEIAVVVPCPSPEGAVETVDFSIAEFPGDTFTG